ncbi:MAG: SIS domain-containing protein, partial [Pygmaiobacter massiliensis]|nr:SIS domain-containing protein [Pygmaiobacter massiliensis]
QQVFGLGNVGDALLAISTSGNSENCIYAAETAKAKGMQVIALTGAKESALSAIADVTVKAPETETYRIQECHLPLYHALCLALEAEFFAKDAE